MKVHSTHAIKHASIQQQFVCFSSGNTQVIINSLAYCKWTLSR